MARLTKALLRDAANRIAATEHPYDDNHQSEFGFMCHAVNKAAGLQPDDTTTGLFDRVLDLHNISYAGTLREGDVFEGYTPFYASEKEFSDAYRAGHPRKQEVRYMFLLLLAESGVF